MPVTVFLEVPARHHPTWSCGTSWPTLTSSTRCAPIFGGRLLRLVSDKQLTPTSSIRCASDKQWFLMNSAVVFGGQRHPTSSCGMSRPALTSSIRCAPMNPVVFGGLLQRRDPITKHQFVLFLVASYNEGIRSQNTNLCCFWWPAPQARVLSTEARHLTGHRSRARLQFMAGAFCCKRTQARMRMAGAPPATCSNSNSPSWPSRSRGLVSVVTHRRACRWQAWRRRRRRRRSRPAPMPRPRPLKRRRCSLAAAAAAAVATMWARSLG